VLLKCTSAYPATAADANLATIPDMRDRFQCEVGLSDHTMGIGVAVAAIALGASVIEKHFTLARADGGVDAAFSLEPAELEMLVSECHHAWQALGTVTYGAGTEAELSSMRFRRSLYFVRDLAAGETIDKDAILAIRPGLGLPPKHRDDVIGRRVSCAVAHGTPVSLAVID
jgi:N-acetylneuraminate synthase